ncbi:polyamine ABC transporter substrate-binding protein [Verrucomicrobiota bacterium sgz303538]
MTKRRFICTAIAALAALTLSAQAQGGKKQTLNIFCWSEYIPQPVIDSFAKQYKVKVNVENYASNEEMLAKLQAGGAKYDLIQPSEYIVEEMAKEGRLEELDLANIPNIKNIDPKFTKMPHDPEGKYSVTWMAGSVGIVVNTNKIKEPIRGFADVFQDKYKKRIVVVNDNRELVSWALSSLGLPINDMSDENLAKAKVVLAKWIPLVRVFDSDSPKTALLNGDVDLGIVWNGEAAKLIEESKKSKRKISFSYVLPSEGAHQFVDNLAIPKGAKNKALAEKFINYVLEPKVSVQVWDEFPYTLANAEGRKLLSAEQLANPASFPPGDMKLDTFRAIPKDRSAAIDKLVTDLKNE